jgi:hypothetical protein
MLDAEQGALKDDAVRMAEATATSPHVPAAPRAVPFETDREAGRSWLKTHWVTAAVLTWILLFGASLRLADVNWDHGQALHPDERFLMIVSGDIRAPSGVGNFAAQPV